jgi:RimJ/RimL family protein N-acetyltransferase
LQALAFLLAQALNLYAESPYLSYPVTISGRAYSKASQRLMERFGFESLGVETQYGPAFVMQAADKNSLFAKLARVGVDRWLG